MSEASRKSPNFSVPVPAQTGDTARSGGGWAASKIRLIYAAEQLAARVGEIASQLNNDYAGKMVDIVAVVDESFVFVADLIRQLEFPVTCHFLRATTTDVASGPVPLRNIRFSPTFNLAGKEILLVAGILQSGLTVDYLYSYLLSSNPASVRTVIVVLKADDRRIDVATDYVAFKTVGRYVVGYGITHKGEYGNVPWIGELAPMGQTGG